MQYTFFNFLAKGKVTDIYRIIIWGRRWKGKGGREGRGRGREVGGGEGGGGERKEGDGREGVRVGEGVEGEGKVGKEERGREMHIHLIKRNYLCITDFAFANAYKCL